MYLQSIKSVQHIAANSVNRPILKESRHIGFGVFIVHSSMMYIYVDIFIRYGGGRNLSAGDIMQEMTNAVLAA
jgi:hypothetical protein